MIKIIKLSKRFGGLSALRNINLEAERDQIVGIIGPNGAGKTTLFNCLTGLYPATEGEIIFQKSAISLLASKNKIRQIHQYALIFFIISLLWAPLFWSFFLPQTFFKVELTVVTLFLLAIRWVVFRGLKQFHIWAWSLVFVFLITDLYLAIQWLHQPSSLGNFLGTNLRSGYFAFLWTAFAVPFNIFFVCQLLLREVRQLYGFRTGPDAICRLGISRTFQNIRLFLNLSVLDNVKIGSHTQMRSGVWHALFRIPSQKAEEAEIEKRAIEYLEFVGLGNRKYDPAGSLPYGEQRRLEIARALASNPQLLLLDEPAAGMNPHESYHLTQLIRKIRKKGITIIMIEHDMKVMMKLADIIYVMDHGELIARGTPEEIRENPKVIEAYLGKGAGYAQA